MTFRRAFFAAFSTALLLGLAWGCAAANNSDPSSPAVGGSNGSAEPANDASVIGEGGPQDAGSLHLNPLCGKDGTQPSNGCVPDSPISCKDFTPALVPSEDAGPSSDAAASGQAGAQGEGGSAGDSVAPVNSSGAGEGGAAGAGERSASGVAGEAGAGGAAGAAGATAAVPVSRPKYGCHVQRIPGAPQEAYSFCSLAGPGGENAPCLTSSDCQAGLGCVGDQNTGLCQRFCCQDADDCEKGTYCAERPLRDATINAGAGTALIVPVCVPAQNCDLSVPYPCPKGSECACKSGTACLVVRSDGTTTCAVPGAGKVGEACPCAWGHVCSAATSQCLELCSTRSSGACGDGKCQAASELPDGWGVCVGVPVSGG